MNRRRATPLAFLLSALLLTACDTTSGPRPPEAPFDAVAGDPAPPANLNGVWLLGTQATATQPAIRRTITILGGPDPGDVHPCLNETEPLTAAGISVVECWFRPIRPGMSVPSEIKGKTYTHMLSSTRGSHSSIEDAYGKFVDGVFKGEFLDYDFATPGNRPVQNFVMTRVADLPTTAPEPAPQPVNFTGYWTGFANVASYGPYRMVLNITGSPVRLDGTAWISHTVNGVQSGTGGVLVGSATDERMNLKATGTSAAYPFDGFGLGCELNLVGTAGPEVGMLLVNGNFGPKCGTWDGLVWPETVLTRQN